MNQTSDFFYFVQAATPAQLFERRDRLYEARRGLKKRAKSAYLAEVNGAIRAIDEALVSAPRESRRGR